MEQVSISAADAVEFEEFKQRKRRIEYEAKIRLLEGMLLRANTSAEEIRALCQTARRLSISCVVCMPLFVKTCKTLLKGSTVGVSCLVGGNSESTLKGKLRELRYALSDGASEIDFFPSVSAAVNGNYAYIRREVKKVIKKARGKTVKVRLDFSTFSKDAFLRTAQAVVDGGARFLSVRANEEDIERLIKTIKKPVSIKAWSVDTLERFQSMQSLGCFRMGSERIEELVEGLRQQSESGQDNRFFEE